MSEAFELADIYVKHVCGAYVTNTIRGKRASSTSSAETAARSLGFKLFGDRLVALELMGRAPTTMIDRFQARARPE